MPLYDQYTVAEGDPEQLRAEARTLSTTAATIHMVTQMLQQVSTHGVWESKSGRTFAGEVGGTPKVLIELANRLDKVARVLRPHADELEQAQRRMAASRKRYEKFDRMANDKEVELRGMTADDPEYTAVDRAQREAGDAREWAKRSFEREGENLHRDELSVKSKLEALNEDAKDDWFYNGLDGLSAVGNSRVVNNPVVGFLPPGKVVKAVSFADPVGQLGRRMFYGEGSYRGVANSAKDKSVDLIKLPLPKGAGAKARAESRKDARRAEIDGVKAKHTNPIGPTGLRNRVAAKARPAAATGKVRARHKLDDTLMDHSGARLVDDMSADWAAIAGAGRVKKGVHVARYTARAGQTVDGHTRRGVKLVESAEQFANSVSASEPRAQDKDVAERRAQRASD